MPGRTEVGEADGEWSDASDDAVKSGSATDGDKDDPGTRHGIKSSLLPLSSSLHRKDPVHTILDKIDAELAAMSSQPTQASKILSRSSTTCKKSLPPLLPKSSQTGKAASVRGLTNGKQAHEPQQLIAGSAEIYTDAALTDVPTDDDGVQQAAEDFLSDLDSVVAQQIDSRFKEIMMKKRVSQTPPPDFPKPTTSSSFSHSTPPPAPPLLSSLRSTAPTTTTPTTTSSSYNPINSYSSPFGSSYNRPIFSTAITGYGTDNDSIKTEDFEHRFQSLIMTDSDAGIKRPLSAPARPKRWSKPSHSSSAINRSQNFGSGSNTLPPRSRSISPPGGSLAKSAAHVGRVSFEDSDAKDMNDEKSANNTATARANGINRVVQHTMKSLGETTPKEVDTTSGVSSLPPSGRSRSVSPERLTSPMMRAVTVADSVQLDSASEEIERQSARIQREVERERRARSVSPSHGLATSHAVSLPPRPARAATPARLQSQPMTTATTDYHSSDPVTVANLGYHIENADKMILGQELKTLRGALLTTKLHLKEAENDARLMREKAEEARSELMLVDFKRTTASKDLSRLMDDIERKKGMAQCYDQEMEVKRSELRGFEALGLTKAEAKTMQEENAALKQRQRGLETVQLERDELARQLETAKEDLLREQRQSRLHREEVSEELEILNARLEETQNGWAMAQQQLQKLEAAYRKMERDKNELIQEQSKEYNALKSLARQESKENRQLLSQEAEVLNKELQTLQVRVCDLQADNRAKDDDNIKLREHIVVLSNQVAQEQAARASVTEDHRKTLQMLRKETDTAMLQLRESLFLDKQRAMEELRAQIEHERRNSSSRTDERMAQMLAENAELISVREAVARERAAMDKETDWKMRNERENLARDTKQRINEMQMTLDHERETNQRLNRDLAQLKEELEEQKRLTREAAKEKLVAVARAKDQIRDQSNAELENVREKIRQEMQREVERLQSQLRSTEDEVRTLKSENQKLLGREQDNLHTLDRTEKTVINEINEECRRSASVLGVSPRHVQLGNLTDTATSRSQITTALANLRAINEELRKHVQELTSELDSCRATMTTMEKEKEETLENMKLELEKKRTLELNKIKEKLIREHSEELAKVAQASARQSVANSMVSALRRKDIEIEELKKALSQWRDQAADKYAKLYKSEMAQELEKSQAMLQLSNQEQKHVNDMQQREIARLETEVQKLAMALSSRRNDYFSPFHTSPPASFTDTALDLYLQMQSRKDLPPPPTPSHHTSQQQQQQYLQARIKQLNSENNALRRKHLLSRHNGSVPDLSSGTPMSLPPSPRRCVSPGPGDKLRNLEERLRLGEKEALMAEERARLKQSVMSHKMAEMAKLQNTLTNQNQELVKLEQAYTQLHRQYNNSPAVAISSILNNTR